MEGSPAVGANLGNSGFPIQTEINGKVVNAKYLDQMAKSRLEQALIQRARQELGKEKDFMSDHEYGIAYSTFHDKIVTGQYSFGSRLSQQWLNTIPGLAALLTVCCGGTTAEWEETSLAYSTECGELIRLITEGSVPNSKAKEEPES